ncbi:MAG: hypothetical protein GNW80_10910 [Asgard group archaeon]|nr:hypothetical protein [Asgard group archaeon]
MKEKNHETIVSPSAEKIEIRAKELEEIIQTKINVNDEFEWKVMLKRKVENDTTDSKIMYKPSEWIIIEYSLDKLVADGLLAKVESGTYRRIK